MTRTKLEELSKERKEAKEKVIEQLLTLYFNEKAANERREILILEALAKRMSKIRLAAELKINRKTLYLKMKRLKDQKALLDRGRDIHLALTDGDIAYLSEIPLLP